MRQLLPCTKIFFLPSSFTFFVMNMYQDSPKDESGVVKAVQNVHAMIDKELAAGTDPKNVFVCGFSQGGVLLVLSLSSLPFNKFQNCSCHPSFANLLVTCELH